MSAVRKNISEIHNRRFHAGALGFGQVTYRPRGRFGPRRQLHYQLVVIHRGSLRVAVDGVVHRVEAGQGILLGPGREESFRFSDHAETTHTWCQLPPALLPPSLAFPAAVIGRPAPCGKWLLRFMQQGWQIPARLQTAEGRKAMIGAVLCAMGQFGTALSAPEAEERPLPAPLAAAARVMEKHLADPLPLDQLARQAALSKGHLIKLAKAHWGMPPIQYLWKLRLEEAARLLRETGWNIGEIAYRTGFANPFHFSRRFRQHFGKGPRAWRSEAWGARE